MKAWVCAVVNALGLAALLAVLPLVGVREDEIVMCSTWVASMQAAQTVVIQNAGWTNSLKRTRIVFLIMNSILALALLFVSHRQIAIAIVTLSGAAFGVAVSLDLSRILSNGSAFAFQLANVRRTIGVLLSAGAAVAVTNAETGFISTFMLLLSLLGLLLPRLGQPVQDARMRNLTWARASATIMGICASLLYRNDVNWIRAAATSETFLEWHYVLLAFSAAQGVAGIAVINHIYARRESIVAATRSAVMGNKVRTTIGVGGVACAVAIMLVPALRPWTLLAPAIVCAIGTTFLSSIAHSAGWSVLPYLAGTAGVAGLLAVLSADGEVGLAWACEFGTTIAVLAAGIVLLLHREATSRSKLS